MFTNEGVGAGHGHAEAYAAYHRQIRQVVTEIGYFRVAQAKFGQQFVEHDQLVLAPLIKVLDTEVLRSTLYHGRLAPADDRGAHAGVDQHLDAVAVQCVERLELAAVGQEIKAAIGEHTIDVEDRQANVAGALQQVFVHYITPARRRSCMFSAPIGNSWSSTTTSELILWSSMIFRASAASISA